MSSTAAVPVAPTARRRSPTGARWGLLAAVLAVAFPFLPVTQDGSTLLWTPADGPVTAPLVALRPLELDATLRCDAPGRLLSTLPPGTPDRSSGLDVTAGNGQLAVDLRGARLVDVPADDGELRIVSTATRTTVTLDGRLLAEVDGDERPQVSGLYSDLRESPGTAVRVAVDNRFDSSATPLKTLAGVAAVLALLGALRALRADDARFGRRPPRGAHPRRDLLRDGAVAAALAVWAGIGAMTADDGYILTMVRAAGSAGWVGNYYRWFDVPEAPFGWFYELYRVWAGVSDALLWLRVPALLMGLACWWSISRHVLPRLRVAGDRSAGWAAATVFLCFWLPFGNGLRPEPLVVLGALLATCAVERAIATRTVLPLALGLVAAAFSVAATPTGLLAATPFLAAARPLGTLLRRRGLAVVGPLAGAGTVVLVAVYADQTWATVAEATRVRMEIGPNLAWFDEPDRYTLLFSTGPDGSLARRFPVLILAVCTVLVVAVLLRRGRIPGVATGPLRRLLISVALGVGVLVLTPTKWTHHFGAFAGIGAAVAAVATVTLGATVPRSRRPLAFAAVLAVTAVAFTGRNNWWYVSNWGVPWFDRPPAVGEIELWPVLLGGAMVVAVVARGRPSTGAPLGVLCGLVVLLEIGSLAVGVEQSPYSLGGSRDGCGLSAQLQVETSPVALPVAPGPQPVGFDADRPGPGVGPVPSSHGDGPLRTSWFAVPARRDAPLVVGVAGSGEVSVELGIAVGGEVRTVATLGSGFTITAEADRRDVRYDLREYPDVDRVRILARDTSPAGRVSVTPPRLPRLTPLLDVIGDAPVFLDWPVAYPHPCLRPSGITDGVAELPRYRVLADPQQRDVGEDWSAGSAGGPLAWITATTRQRLLPTYLRGDWGRDWGRLHLLEPWTPAAQATPSSTHETVWGTTTPGPIGPPPARGG